MLVRAGKRRGAHAKTFPFLTAYETLLAWRANAPPHGEQERMHFFKLRSLAAALAVSFALAGLEVRAADLSGAHLPDHAKTPGAVASTDMAAVCTSGHAEEVRHVSSSERNRIYLAYGIARGHRKGYVIDHLISLELGGSNDTQNLWPQPRVEAKQKDRVEAELHADVCSGKIPLRDAQQRIARDWRTAVPDDGSVKSSGSRRMNDD